MLRAVYRSSMERGILRPNLLHPLNRTATRCAEHNFMKSALPTIHAQSSLQTRAMSQLKTPSVRETLAQKRDSNHHQQEKDTMNSAKFALLFTAALLTGSCSEASKKEKNVEHVSNRRVPLSFSKAQGIDFVKQIVETYPEVLHLVGDVKKTEEATGVALGSFSYQMFGQKHDEFDRTVLTLICLRCFIDGSDTAFHAFAQAQDKGKLDRNSFHQVHLMFDRVLNSGWRGLSRGARSCF